MSNAGDAVSVLMYHHVGPANAAAHAWLTIPPARFKRQLDALRRWGFTIVSASNVMAWRQGLRPLPRRAVLLTFDDAFADICDHALPALAERGLPSLVFVPTAYIGATYTWDEGKGSSGHRIMSEVQIREWASQGVEFGVHTASHVDLCTVAPDRVVSELEECKTRLGSILGRPPDFFAYPYGAANADVRAAAVRFFHLCFGVEEGLNDRSSDAACFRRTMVWPSDNLVDLLLRAGWGWSALHRLKTTPPGRYWRAPLYLLRNIARVAG